jgi:aspartyl-tRNA(Asn)/glutamyl-tRNA(Gln) amidotransferase subunit B
MSTQAAWETVIGLEVHCQLATASKLFSPCPVRRLAEPNTLVDAYTLGLPGTLPVVNAAAVRSAVALALATGCEVQRVSEFARKHYFYPDLPKGYQITQGTRPYAVGGSIEIPSDPPQRVRLTRIHIEEDAGKNVHVAGEDVSLLDYNRAGAPLLEIVGEPDLRSSQQAADYLRELRSIVRALGISEANMEEGTLRCDANVSLRPRGSPELGTRCEIKNLNSFRFLAQAIEAEIRRQTDILDGGGRVQMATLSYDPERDRTRVMRTKEEAADYRYMPEPDLPPLRIDAATIEAIAAELPPLPAARRQRWHAQGVSADDARLLSDEPALARYFDAVLEAGAGATDAANWVTGDLLGKLNAEGHAIDDVRVDPGTLAEILALVGDGTVSRAAGKRVLLHVYDRGGTAAEAVETLGLRQLSDPGALEAVVREILDASPNQLAQYRAGKTNLRGYFVGQVMKKTGGKANPKVVVELLDRLLISEP